MIAIDRSENWSIDSEIESRSECDRAQHAHWIFLKPLFWHADASDQSVPDVVESSDVVDDRPSLDVVEQRVQREIASKRVFFGRTERVVMVDQQIRIVGGRARRGRNGRRGHGLFFGARRDLTAEGCHLDYLRAELHVREAEAPADDPAIPEEPLYLVGMRGGADIEVFRRAAEQQIAHAAANQVGDVVELPEPVQDLEGVRVDVLS